MNKQIYIIHENDEWVVPLREELKKIDAPYKEWHMGRDKIDFSKIPPNGVFYNRMSASSHTRGHHYAHHLGENRNERDKYRGHKYYKDTVDFCENWDQKSFDPNYKSLTLKDFEPYVKKIFSRKPYTQ